MLATTVVNAPSQDMHAELRQKTVINAFWSYFSFVLSKGLSFVAIIILARLLNPNEFGLLAYCLLGIAYLEILSRFGLDKALISRRDGIDEASNVIFLLSVINGAAFYGVAWLAAPYVAMFFREDAIIQLFRVLSLVLLIDSLAVVHQALLQRHLRFRAGLIPVVGRGFVKGVLSIALALAGFGVWALVWGQLAGALFATMALWFMVSWRPALRFDSGTSREVLRFGMHMIAVELIGALRSNVDYFFIGRFLGASALGLYTVGYRLPELIIRSLDRMVGAVTHPIMAQLQDDETQVKRYYAAYVRYTAVFTLPAGVGLVTVAQPLVLTFYTEKWTEAIFPMQCIAIALAIASIGFIPGVLYKAINRPEILSRVAFLKLPFMLVVLWYATRYGLDGVALAQVLLACFYVTVDCVVVRRVIGFGFRQLFTALAPAIAAACVMGALTGLAAWQIASDDAFEAILLVFLGVTVYAGTLRIVSREVCTQAVELWRSFQGGRQVRNA